MDAKTRGTALVAVGVALFVVTMAGGAAVAPDRGVGDGAGDERATLIGVQGGGPGWHQHGEVVYRQGGSVEWRVDDADSYFDVQRTDDGRVLAGFMNGDVEDCGPYESPCARTGFHVIDPGSDPEVVDGYSFPVRTEGNSEIHDVEPLGDGEYLLTDMDRERLVIVADGEVVWEWAAADVYQPPEDPTRTDWLHINDVDVIEDDRFLVSVRNANQLLIVERTDDGGSRVVETVNEDDGSDEGACADQLFGDDPRCGDPAVLDHQHNPMWLGETDDGQAAVLVADSDNDRVVELHRDADGNWSVAWAMTSAGDIPLDWPRDADRLSSGNTLITDTLNKRVIEVDENGTVVWSATTDRIPYEAERLPEGERTVGEWYGDADAEVADPGGGIPGLSLLVVGVKAAFPWLPVWIGEIHVAATLASLLCVGTGGVARWRAG